MEEVKPTVMQKSQFGFRDTSTLSSFLGFFGLSGFRRKDQDPPFFFVKKCSSFRKVLFEPLIEKFKLIVLKKCHFENLHIIIDNISRMFGWSRIAIKVKTNALTAHCYARCKGFPKHKEIVLSSFVISSETSALHRFDINLPF